MTAQLHHHHMPNRDGSEAGGSARGWLLSGVVEAHANGLAPGGGSFGHE